MHIVTSRLQRAKRGRCERNSVMKQLDVKKDSKKFKKTKRLQSDDSDVVEKDHSGKCAADSQSFAELLLMTTPSKSDLGKSTTYVQQVLFTVET